MNKKLLIFLFLISLNFLNSQINIKKIEYIGDTIVKLSKKYDGKSDFIEQKNIDDYKQYIGYNIFLTDSKSDEYFHGENYNYIFDDKLKFVLNFQSDTIYTYLNNPVGIEKKESIKTDYQKFQNKTYKIIDIIPSKNISKLKSIFPKMDITPERYIFNSEYDFVFLKLKDLISKENFYLVQSLKSWHTNNTKDFIFEPYYEYLKSTYNNKKFIFHYSYHDYEDIYTGKKVRMDKKSIWDCEISIINSFRIKNDTTSEIFPYKIYALLKNEFGETIALENIDNIVNQSRNNGRTDFELFDDYVFNENQKKISLEKKKLEVIKLNKIKQKDKENFEKNIYSKYGSKWGKTILNNQISVGMTTDMCISSWGDPYDITKIIDINNSIEIWHYYGGNTVYFNNNKITRIIVN